MVSADTQIAFLLYDTPDNAAQVQVVTREFYAQVQNRFHFAITGQTAAEINA